MEHVEVTSQKAYELALTEAHAKPDELTELMLKEGARQYENFALRPKKYAGNVVPLRLRITSKFGGWKLKDELVEALGLAIGDCINTEVSVLLTHDLLADSDDMDLFADGEAADWLLNEIGAKGGSPVGCTVDCYVLLSLCQAPVGGFDKVVNKASLILLRGIKFSKNTRR